MVVDVFNLGYYEGNGDDVDEEDLELDDESL